LCVAAVVVDENDDDDDDDDDDDQERIETVALVMIDMNGFVNAQFIVELEISVSMKSIIGYLPFVCSRPKSRICSCQFVSRAEQLVPTGSRDGGMISRAEGSPSWL
jgi:hypothetical protein